MAKPWFRNKTYGWGWVPASWQGWVVGLLYVVAVVAAAVAIMRPPLRPVGVLAFVGVVAAETVALVMVCYLTGEKPRWNWGNRDRSDR